MYQNLEILIHPNNDCLNKNGNFANIIIRFNYLFASVLNQYLSDIISINSFIELKILQQETQKIKAYWMPTSGKQDLI